MDSKEYTSLFDQIEETEENPEQFQWLNDPLQAQYLKEQIIYKGNLISVDEVHLN